MDKPQPVLSAADVSAEWLSEVLAAAGRLSDGRVTDVRYAACGTGQLGDSYRFHLSYSAPGAGPATLVGKFASQDPTSREFGRSSGYYRNEIGFYTELVGQLPVSVPTALYAALDVNQTDFVLLMDDLAPARQVDQILGCTVDEAVLIMDQAAALHAASWQRAEWAALPWLQGTAAMFQHVTDRFAEVIAAFPTLCSDLVPQADLDEAARLEPLAARWREWIATPRCLWHSDLRADNVLFDAEDGRRPVVVLDWQGLGYGQGTIDIALWMGTSLPTELRRAHERALVARYHEGLLRGGVRDYTAEQCWADYRVNAIHGLQVGVFGLGAVKRTDRGDRMWQAWIERTAAHVRDLDSFSALAAR